MSLSRRAIGWSLVAVAVNGAGAVVHACPVCFRMEDGPIATGVRAAVIVLVAVTTIVLVPCAVFVARFARRAAANGREDRSA